MGNLFKINNQGFEMTTYIKNEGHWIEIGFIACMLTGFILGYLIRSYL